MLRNFLSEINPAFFASQLKNALRHCQGLCSSLPHKSLSSMANSLLAPLDQSSLNRFLNECNWGCEVRQLDINRLHLMQKNQQTAFKKKGVFCLDDTLLTKTGKTMELTCNHFDHCSFSVKRGLSLVSLHYRDDTKNYNLFKEVYLRKSYLEARGRAHEFKTKLELAQDMLTTLIETEPSVLDLKPHFVFDSWFLSRNLTSLLESFNLKYVSRAKSNRVIKGLNMNLAEYANLILKDCD
ncbi:MAG: transposase, partial [Promethearchaeota archaeon]